MPVGWVQCQVAGGMGWVEQCILAHRYWSRLMTRWCCLDWGERVGRPVQCVIQGYGRGREFHCHQATIPPDSYGPILIPPSELLDHRGNVLVSGRSGNSMKCRWWSLGRNVCVWLDLCCIVEVRRCRPGWSLGVGDGITFHAVDEGLKGHLLAVPHPPFTPLYVRWHTCRKNLWYCV